MDTNLTQFYDELKQKLNNDETPTTNVTKISTTYGGPLSNSPNAVTWRNKAAMQCNHLKDCCHKQLLLDIYCKILPLDKEFIDGNRGLMKQDINAMLANKGMSATQYMTSCYESTNAPLLEFVIRSVDNIGKWYMSEADEVLKDAQENEKSLPDPEAPSVDDHEVKSQLVEIESDTEYENFVDELKQRTIDKIVNDVTKIINDKKEEENMTFDTTPIADVEEKMESTTSLALNYIQKKLMKENVEITPELQDSIMAMAIRESTLNQFDVVFRQPNGVFREYASRMRYGKGILINESTTF